MNSITPQELMQLKMQNPEIDLLDVRTPLEFREVHVEFARNVPLDQLDPATIRSNRAGNQPPVYVICQAGSRGEKAVEKLEKAGIVDAVNVAGGTAAWTAASLPVVRGAKTISLERQVRIAAGMLVLAGVGLGFVWHPICYALAAFVGAGLTFAGITDTCGMGMLLAKMPWNQPSRTQSSGDQLSGASSGQTAREPISQG